MLPIELAKRLALLLLLAFFLGLAFEEVYKRDEPTIPGGIRTFPLVGLAGAMLYLVEPTGPRPLSPASSPWRRGYTRSFDSNGPQKAGPAGRW
jgi:hypothetical protein